MDGGCAGTKTPKILTVYTCQLLSGVGAFWCFGDVLGTFWGRSSRGTATMRVTAVGGKTARQCSARREDGRWTVHQPGKFGGGGGGAGGGGVDASQDNNRSA